MHGLSWKGCAPAAKPRGRCLGGEGACWWPQPTARWPQPGAAPHQLHLSPSFGHLESEDVLSVCLLSVCLSEQGCPYLVEEAKVKVMLPEKVTMPRLASPHLPGLHPYAFIFLFSLCEQRPLPELPPPAPDGRARSRAGGSKGGRGVMVVSSPTGRGSGGSAGAPRRVSAAPGTPLPSAPCGAASPKMPLVSPADSWHGEPALLPTAAPGRGGGLPGRGERGLVRGKPFPAAKQQSCADMRSCTGAAI